jgi:hypothetical protein
LQRNRVKHCCCSERKGYGTNFRRNINTCCKFHRKFSYIRRGTRGCIRFAGAAPQMNRGKINSWRLGYLVRQGINNGACVALKNIVTKTDLLQGKFLPETNRLK